MIRRETLMILLIPILLVGPAAAILGIYVVTKDPSLRPLGITLERLIEAGQVDNEQIIVEVRVGSLAKLPAPREQFEAALERAFKPYNTEVTIRFKTIPGSTASNVTYLVGSSRIGPFSPNRAADGIRAAAEAERLLVAHRKSERARNEKRLESAPWYERIFAQ